jgi:omega-6 fatty acid desaturase (delta-12 desaturase)
MNARSGIHATAHRKQVLLPLALFGLAAGLYVATWLAIFRVSGVARLPVSLANGFFIGVVFIIGHDACHGAFVRPAWLNRVIGRLAFLPSLQPYSFWELGHNRMHHGWTNLREKDYPWAPFSKAEFHRLSPGRRLVERVGRTFFGVAVYYGVVIWWSHMAFPDARDRQRVEARIGWFDRLSVLAFFIGETAVAYTLEVGRGGGAGVACMLRAFLFGVAVPFVMWIWMAGLLTFVQHTHERVRWYDRREEWSFLAGSLHGTVHVVFPRAVDLVLHNVMFHTAHHVDTRIPLYNLPEAQSALEAAHGDGIIRQRFSIGAVLGTLRRCKLYDYRQRQWLDYAGQPTTAPASDAASVGDGTRSVLPADLTGSARRIA